MKRSLAKTRNKGSQGLMPNQQDSMVHEYEEAL